MSDFSDSIHRGFGTFCWFPLVITNSLLLKIAILLLDLPFKGNKDGDSS